MIALRGCAGAAGSTMEIAGSSTNSQRALQWREKVIDPVFEAKGDYEITHLLATKLGFAEELFKHIGIENGEAVAEDITPTSIAAPG